ncbi:PepSY-associated TM helix domain-containing protein [Rhizorhabdus dicambivorans]|uniref:PepSY domain-containing protein n=1 Tax=Rhizorhabdus dicambivorans TaxID=1850238 RepID=A0A2A4G2U8_9SPHN|nr:PepSY domain-containing protein [Rhizorhabdus dicambivorans]ATE65089.1 PepSY domain-containing protein [Rhizorhabdus dicambivorans]PCE44362.1 PepSY domain-containing protein [Rhizorhabdus dicambivorans]
MSVQAPGSRWYNAVWRWHFYAGLFCIPLILCLSVTGSLYLFRPQIEALIDRPYAQVAGPGPRMSAARIADAAVAAVPGSVLHRYQLPDAPDQAVQVIVGSKGGAETRVYVHPQTLAILKTVAEQDRLMRFVFRLHGELMIGDPGSWIVETAACWAIMMILTGVYLWWPRSARGLGGVLWPRLTLGGRGFWRDLHAVVAIWISALALLLILTGLPWANVWGGYLKEVRALTHQIDGPQDWSTSSRSGTAQMTGDHAEHGGMTMEHPRIDYAPLDRIIAQVAPMNLAAPVLIAPPAGHDGLWTAKSDSANRPLRTSLTLDGVSGTVVGRKDFAERHWIDRAVGYGIAVHEGQLFGWANQLLGLIAALGLFLTAATGAVMWWRRRPHGLLGAPLPLGRPRFGPALTGAILLLGLVFPMFGVTLLLVLALEWGIFRRNRAMARWLGLARAVPPAS